MAKKYCYLFTEGNASMREILGGKGANLAEMTNIGLPVPQGFTISTEACTQYYEDGRQINDEIMAEIMEYIVKMEEVTGKKFGDLENPLLVSVRSGEYQNYSEVWRLFDCLYDGNPDNLPADTSLRRAYIERIKSGKLIGHGTGVIVFDKLKTR